MCTTGSKTPNPKIDASNDLTHIYLDTSSFLTLKEPQFRSWCCWWRKGDILREPKLSYPLLARWRCAFPEAMLLFDMLLLLLPAAVGVAAAWSKLGEDLERCEAWLPVLDLMSIYIGFNTTTSPIRFFRRF